MIIYCVIKELTKNFIVSLLKAVVAVSGVVKEAVCSLYVVMDDTVQFKLPCTSCTTCVACHV